MNSQTVLIATMFLGGTVTYTDLSTNTVVTTLPASTSAKGNSRGAGGSPVECEYKISNNFEVSSPVTLPDGTVLVPGVPYNVSIDGHVQGFIPSQKP